MVMNHVLRQSINMVRSNSSKANQRQIFLAIQDAEILISAPREFHKVWIQLRKLAILTDNNITKKSFEPVFNEFEGLINQVFRLKNIDEFFDIIDQDQDGVLNEDDQIMIFSLLNQKMNQVSQDLLMTQQYDYFRKFMEIIRDFEKKIVQYQNELRQGLYRDELDVYKQIGENRLNEFYNKYYSQITQFQKEKERRITQLKHDNHEQYQQMQFRHQNQIQDLKIKPRKVLKEVEMQEKLVAVMEKVEEATNLKRELNNLEVQEINRVQNILNRCHAIQKQKLFGEQEKTMNYLLDKLQIQENDIFINMIREFDVLSKKIKIHENQIRRIQALTTKLNIKKGTYDVELRRFKNMISQQNKYIHDSKQQKETNIENEQNVSQNNTTRQTMKITAMNSKKSFVSAFMFNSKKENKAIQQMKTLKNSKGVIHFYIRQKIGDDKPVNISNKTLQVNDDQHYKVEKYLTESKKIQDIPSLTTLYDSKLNLIDRNNKINDKEDNRNQIRKRKFINSKLGPSITANNFLK